MFIIYLRNELTVIILKEQNTQTSRMMSVLRGRQEGRSVLHWRTLRGQLNNKGVPATEASQIQHTKQNQINMQ